MRSAPLLFLATVLPLAASLGCAPGPAETDGEYATEKKGVVCAHTAADPTQVLNRLLHDRPGALDSNGNAILTNFTAWPSYDPDSNSATIDPKVIAARTDAKDARANLASRFGDCSGKVETHLAKSKPNVYVYFTGYGGPNQNNSVIDQDALIKWINDRDPKGLIFSINWNCAGSADKWCSENAKTLSVSTTSPEYQSMAQSLNAFGAEQLLGVVESASQQQLGYDSALSHSMQLAAQLIDQILVADKGPGNKSLLGNIYIAGYSMGAHAAAQLLVQDFTADDSVGYKWTRPLCENGESVCTVAGLKKVKWSLGLGLSGWSDALQRHNGFDGGALPSRDPKDIEQFRNGGLIRIRDPRYNGKLNVFNRRMDPTANSDDTFERGFGDLFYSDYNHYSHDYSLPLFLEPAFVRALDAFLESKEVEDSKEFGIIYDNAGLVDFDGCPESGGCTASTNYLAHASNRSHQQIDEIETPEVPTVDGVPHPEKTTNRAASFDGDGAQPIALQTFDQEDLRGGVELSFRPKFDTTGSGTHGLFSYGSCKGESDDLQPAAYFQDGKLVFETSWQGKNYQATVDLAEKKIESGSWTHLAFTWELPVVSLTVPHSSAAEAEASKAVMGADVQKYQAALVLANGLRKPLPTTYKRQQGKGTMRIFVNGELAAEGDLGAEDSARDCLPASEVLSKNSYDVNGVTYPAWGPYASYDAAHGDIVSLGGSQTIGTKCKAYRVRNEEAFFGCAKSEGVNAQGDMDDITLVWGPGRTDYDNVVKGTGAPAIWPIGPSYTSKAFKAK